MKGGAQRPHVLVVHTGEGPVRGAERVALTLMRVLRSSWRFTLLTNHAALHDAALAAGEASLYDDLLGLPAGVPSGSRGRRLAAAARILATVWHLSRLLREQEVALVHLSNGHAAGLMLLPALVAGVPMLAHLHAPLSRRTQIRFGIFAADRIVGVAAFLGDVWARCPPIRAKVRTIHNGIEPTAPPASAPDRARLGIAAGEFVLLTASVLTEAKAVDLAISAVAALHGQGRWVHLLVLGDGPQRAELEAAAAGLPVSFLGQRADARELMASVADVFLLPSRALEAHSIGLLEAGLAGLPRVVSGIPGNVEAVTDGEDALVFPPGDAAALAGQIARLQDDPALCRRLGEAARHGVERRFSLDAFRDGFDALFREMLAEDRGRLRRLRGLGASLLGTVRRLGGAGPGDPRIVKGADHVRP
jgi:glycosyltransferase involved in cell wall biosynthesis